MRKEGALAWERENHGPHDVAVYRSEILPHLAQVTLPQIIRATGLTSSYCWRPAGERVPHPMYWEPLAELIRRGTQHGGADDRNPT
jgi:hypothetical protein